jgi:polyisoprenoid-binding protein YceI
MSTWKIDPAHTDVTFSVKHMMVTTVRGKFDAVDGELELDLDGQDPTTASGEIRLGVASLSTGAGQRDAHLRSPDFFDAENYPEIVARLTGIEPNGDDYRVKAEVTIRDITRPVTFDGRYLGLVPGMQGGRHAGFELSATIDREQWDLNWNMALEAGGWLVAKDVRLVIDVAADEVEAAATGEADKSEAA